MNPRLYRLGMYGWAACALVLLFLKSNPLMAQARSPLPPKVAASAAVADGLVVQGSPQRIQRLITDGDKPLLLPLVKGFPSVIELPEGEKIQDIAVGGLSDWSSAWEIVRRESSFYIKPLQNAQITTLLVGTTERNYVMDMQPLANTPDNQGKRLSRLILTRPAPAPTQATGLPTAMAAPDPSVQQANPLLDSAQAQADALQRQIQALKNERFNKRDRNYHYTMEVVALEDDIRPREVFDDGRFTYLKFPNALQIPAVYRGGAAVTEETLVNSHIQDDYLVIHGVHTRWVLRLGGSVIGIYNEKFNPEGTPTQSGTSDTSVRVMQ